MRHRDRFRRLILLVGARTPSLLPYQQQLDEWLASMERLGVELHLTVDQAEPGWLYGVGVVTTLFEKAGIEPARTTAFICGPEIMMRFSSAGALRYGGTARATLPVDGTEHAVRDPDLRALPARAYFVCTDGPVFRYDEVRDLMEVPDL